MSSEFRWINVENEDGVTLVTFKDLRLESDDVARGCSSDLARLGRQLHNAVVIDFKDVRQIQSHVLNRLLSLQSSLRRHETQMRLCQLEPSLSCLLRAMHIERAFDIRETIDQALRGK